MSEWTRSTGAHLSAGQAFRLAFAADVARLVASDPVARIGADIEGVHQARVASRRLRSDLSTFSGVLEPGSRKELLDDLRRLARRLGSVRDLDVLELHLGDLGVLDAPLVRAELQRQRSTATERLDRMLGSSGYAVLLRELAGWVARPRLRRSAGLPAEAFLEQVVSQRVGALLEDAADLHEHSDIEALHALRIVAKRARYACEQSIEVLGRDVQRLARACTALCDLLGDLHDADVALAWIRSVDIEAAATVERQLEDEIATHRRAVDARLSEIELASAPFRPFRR